jgi:hypothetical protein
MSVAPMAEWPFDKFSLERRSRQRFPLTLAVEYRLLDHDERWGSGKTCNISSTGALFEVGDRRPLFGSRYIGSPYFGSIELLVSWPYLLDGMCPLKLLMKGYVVRSEGRGVAIESSRHEFRTAGVRAARMI